MQDLDLESRQMADAVWQSQIDGYFSLASVVLVYYEYFVTLDDEIRFFWRRRRRAGMACRRINTTAVLFFLNRYVPIALNATIIAHNLGDLLQAVGFLHRSSDTVEFVTEENLSCERLHTLDQMGIVFVQIIVGMVTALRTWALYERSRTVWMILASIFVLALGVALWSVLASSHGPETIHVPARFGCHTSLSNQEGKQIAAPWIVLMVYDAVVFSLTLRKALAIWKLGSSRLFQIMVRDGSIFFFVMTMANLSNVLVLILAPAFLKDVCTAFTSAISVIMISRLMVNIQNPALLEEPRSTGRIATEEVGTLVTFPADVDSRFTTSRWTLEEQQTASTLVV